MTKYKYFVSYAFLVDGSNNIGYGRVTRMLDSKITHEEQIVNIEQELSLTNKGKTVVNNYILLDTIEIPDTSGINTTATL